MTKALEVRTLCAALVLLLVWPLGFAQSLPELIEGVLASHPSLRAQKALGESAKDAVEGAKWQFFPTPSIGFEQANTGSSDPNYPSFGDKNITTLRLQQPLWTGGRLSAGLDRAKAGVVSSQATLDGVRQDLALRVLQSYADW
jgi:adhesin transport system outer membrane protein